MATPVTPSRRNIGGVPPTPNSVARLKKGLFDGLNWRCDCNPRRICARYQVKKDGLNQGRWFYRCPLSDEAGCGLFLWESEAKLREPGGSGIPADIDYPPLRDSTKKTPHKQSANQKQQQQQFHSPPSSPTPRSIPRPKQQAVAKPSADKGGSLGSSWDAVDDDDSLFGSDLSPDEREAEAQRYEKQTPRKVRKTLQMSSPGKRNVKTRFTSFNLDDEEDNIFTKGGGSRSSPYFGKDEGPKAKPLAISEEEDNIFMTPPARRLGKTQAQGIKDLFGSSQLGAPTQPITPAKQAGKTPHTIFSSSQAPAAVQGLKTPSKNLFAEVQRASSQTPKAPATPSRMPDISSEVLAALHEHLDRVPEDLEKKVNDLCLKNVRRGKALEKSVEAVRGILKRKEGEWSEEKEQLESEIESLKRKVADLERKQGRGLERGLRTLSVTDESDDYQLDTQEDVDDFD